MIIHYINLDSATIRRNSIESSFLQNHGSSEWKLSRFAAINSDDHRIKTIAGSCTNKEKACFLSHATLVQQASQSKEFHWIVEDDARFWQESFMATADFIKNHEDDDWDILFTDLTIRSFGSMVDLYIARKKLPIGQVEYINVGACPFCSAVSYIINPKRAQKVASILSIPPSIDRGWDIYLASAIQEGKLTAYFTLPFVTSFADCAQTSQIREMDVDIPGILGRSFRSLMCLEPNTLLIKEMLSQIDAHFVDDQADCFGKIMAGFMADNFPKV